jgi:hypothetical protein
MRLILATIVLTSVLTTWTSSANAQTDCPWYRPCGPGETWGGNRWIKQGFFGADFRPACQAHDTCEASPRECDRRFLQDMYTACESSTNPHRCRKKARTYYLASRIYHSIPKPLRRIFQR